MFLLYHGIGEIWSGKIWHNQGVPSHGILRSEAIFLGSIVSALGMRIPFVPAQYAQQGRFGRLQASRK